MAAAPTDTCYLLSTANMSWQRAWPSQQGALHKLDLDIFGASNSKDPKLQPTSTNINQHQPTSTNINQPFSQGQNLPRPIFWNQDESSPRSRLAHCMPNIHRWKMVKGKSSRAGTAKRKLHRFSVKIGCKNCKCTTAIKTEPLGNLSLKQGWRARRQLRNVGTSFSENGANHLIESPNKPTIRDNTQKIDPVDGISIEPLTP